MGTTASFLYLQNRAFTPRELRELLARCEEVQNKQDNDMYALLKDVLRHVEHLSLSELELSRIFHPRKGPPRAVAAYRRDGRWLPLYLHKLCSNNVVDNGQLRRLSQLFQTPVLSLAMLDSDVLFVSYCDEKTGAIHDHFKANFPRAEPLGYGYSAEFPEFLLFLSEEPARSQLQAIWDEEEVVFADDRLERLAEALNLPVIYDFSGDLGPYLPIIAPSDPSEP